LSAAWKSCAEIALAKGISAPGPRAAKHQEELAYPLQTESPMPEKD
jgi:hypothetical protein